VTFFLVSWSSPFEPFFNTTFIKIHEHLAMGVEPRRSVSGLEFPAKAWGPKPHPATKRALFTCRGTEKKILVFFIDVNLLFDILQFSNLVCPSTRILSPVSEQKEFIDKHHVKS